MGFPPAPNIHTYICKKETHLPVRPAACKMLTNKMERSVCPCSTGTGSGAADSSNSQGTGLTRALRTIPAFSVNSRPLLQFERASKAQQPLRSYPGCGKTIRQAAQRFLLDTWAFTSRQGTPSAAPLVLQSKN